MSTAETFPEGVSTLAHLLYAGVITPSSPRLTGPLLPLSSESLGLRGIPRLPLPKLCPFSPVFSFQAVSEASGTYDPGLPSVRHHTLDCGGLLSLPGLGELGGTVAMSGTFAKK